MGFVIAAYGIVIGSLLLYGIWVQVQRKRLMRELEAQRSAAERSAGRSA